jgi:hypothetical protein
MMYSRIALHEHLSTNKYRGNRWDFDEVVGVAKRRLDNNGVLVVSGFADARLKTDGRYEIFVRRPSHKYSKKNLDGKAVLVEGRDTNLLVVSGLEAEIGHGIESGSVLVLGVQEDTGLEAGPDVSHVNLLSQIPADAFSFYVHPFHVGGSGPFLDKVLRERDAEPYLRPVDGVEVFNAQACLPVPGYFNANDKAVRFFYRAREEGFRLSPVKGSDGHSLSELASVSTTSQRELDFNALRSWEEAYKGLWGVFSSLSSQMYEGDCGGTKEEKLCGILGAARHAFALTVARKLGFPKIEDW